MWALTAMMGGNTNLIAKSCLSAWREELATLRQERIVEKLKEELFQLKAKGDESTMRALTAMMGGSTQMIAKSCLTAWREELATLRQERIVEKLKEENIRLKAKGD